MALNNCRFFDILGVLGTELVFTEIAASAVVMSGDLQGCTMSCLFADEQGRLG